MSTKVLDAIFDVTRWLDDSERLTDEVWARVIDEGYEPYGISSMWRRVAFNVAWSVYSFACDKLI